jgi:predicted DNA binding CopG/RHH family protein
MKKNYDFSSARPNPYAALLKRPVTIRLDRTSVEYFKAMAEAEGIPYQSLINLYLRDCVAKKRKLNLTWK